MKTTYNTMSDFHSLYPIVDSIMEAFSELPVHYERKSLITKGNFPKINLRKPKDQDLYIMEVGISGYNKEDVKVSIENRKMTFKYDKPEEVNEDKYFWKEMTTSSFTREVILPDFIDIDKIESSYKDGIITINLPISERAKPKALTF